MSAQIKDLMIMMTLFLQFKTAGFAQDTSAKEANRPDSVTSLMVDKNTTREAHSLTNYLPATFPGGDKAFTRYLLQNVGMPSGYTQKVAVSIIVTFTIEESGTLNNLHASDGPNPLKKEAIRVIKNSGRWIPAYKDGKPLSSERQQKISFKFNQ